MTDPYTLVLDFTRAKDAGAGTAEMAMVLGELRALFQGAEHKVGELLERLARRPDGER
jgi:hypothetical protein